MYIAASMNQFETEDTSFEFVINVSRQGNNVKVKLNLKRTEISALIFC